jgi:hypothetical protein
LHTFSDLRSHVSDLSGLRRTATSMPIKRSAIAPAPVSSRARWSAAEKALKPIPKPPIAPKSRNCQAIIETNRACRIGSFQSGRSYSGPCFLRFHIKRGFIGLLNGRRPSGIPTLGAALNGTAGAGRCTHPNSSASCEMGHYLFLRLAC